MGSTVEVLADAFLECGTSFIAGHPGGETVELMDAARARDMRYILMKQEVAGAMMAATWGEITGSPGVCTSTRGPGAASMVNGVAHAWLDRAPLIALTDQYPRHTYETGLRQVLNLQQIFAPITKWQTTLHARSVRTQIRRALRTAMAPAPGPVHIDVPADQTRAEAAELAWNPPLLGDRVPMEPDPNCLGVPLDMLRRATRPIVLAGLGVLWNKACGQLTAFVERLGAPILTTAVAMPSDHDRLIVYLDGEFVPWNEATIHVFSPLAKYGAGVFEGIRGYWSERRGKMLLFRLREHMERLELSQRIMRFGEIVPADDMCAATLELVRRNCFRTSVHIRPTVYVDGEGGSSARSPIGTFITAVPRGTPKRVDEGCTAQISSWERISDRSMPARAKANANYNNARFAGIQAGIDGYDAAILLNSRGKVAEAQGMCLFLIRDGVAVTPSVTSDILESITRDTVQTLLREMGIDTRERDVDRSEFFAASEAFFCGTGWEITPINSIDGAPIGGGRPGEVTQRLQIAYFDLVKGVSGDRRGWLSAV